MWSGLSVARFVTEMYETLTKENKMPKKRTKKAAARKKAVATKKASVKRAGRPKGSGQYGCETKAVRVPVHLEDDVKSFVMRKIKAGK